MKCLAKHLLPALLLSTLNGDVVWAQTGSTTPTITLRIYNYAHVESETLIRAEREAGRIYHHIGVETVWVEQPMPPEDEQEELQRRQTSDFRLNILSHAIEGPGLLSSSLGLAPGAGHNRDRAYVFFDRLENLSRTQIAAAAQGKVYRWTTPAQILGYAMAHEVGHLLGLSHSAKGIMRDGWRWNELLDAAYGDLNFTPPQAAVIRTEVQIRTRAQ